jgi:hypothetical protein
MRIVTLSMALGSAMIFGLAGGALLAQDQPAAGAPPSSVESQPASGSQTNDAQPGNAQSNEAPPSGAETASPRPKRTPNPEREAKSLAKRLALTPEQESALAPILAARRQKIEQARSNPELTPRARRAQVQKIQRESRNKIEAILTDTQKQQYQQWEQERRANRQMRRQKQAGAPPAANNE